MVNVRLKHITENNLRSFYEVGINTEKRAEWVRNNSDKYETVADIEIDANELMKAFSKVFSATQNLDESWITLLKNKQPDNVYVDRCRSTSVGDIVEANGQKFFVDSFGFSPIIAEAY